MRIVVGRTYRFRATHSLPDFPPPWCFEHEHDYTVEAEAEGGTSTDIIDKWWDSLRAYRWGMDTDYDPSTVENIAGILLDGAPDQVHAITVWEDKQRWGRAER